MYTVFAKVGRKEPSAQFSAINSKSFLSRPKDSERDEECNCLR